MRTKWCHRSRKKAVEDATSATGARDVKIIEEPIALRSVQESIYPDHVEI